MTLKKSQNVKISFEDAMEFWLESVADKTNSGHDIFIFSPFITGNLTVDLFRRANPSTGYLITNVKAQSVLAGSLDLAILRQLIKEKVKVFHLDKLHSKILFYGQDLIIGSQNFTRGGRSNDEATVGLIVTNDLVDRIIDYVNTSIEKATPISVADLDKLGSNVEQLREEYKNLQNLIQQSEKPFLQKKQVNQKYKELANETAIKLMKVCNENLWNTVKIERRKYTIPQREDEYYYTFLRTKTKMTLNEFKSIPSKRRVTLEHQRRYLGLNLHNLQPFWLPANKTQVGKFSRQRNVSKTFYMFEFKQIELFDPNENNNFSNVKFSGIHAKNQKFEIDCFFDGEKIELRETSLLTGVNVYDFTCFIEQILLEPFDFEDRNIGDKPNRYFKKGKRYNLSLIEYKKLSFLALCERETFEKKSIVPKSGNLSDHKKDTSYLDAKTFFNFD